MKTTKTPLSQIRANGENPRTISPENLQKLIGSILELPKMLEMRPIVTDGDGLILGGNMRHRALCSIAEMVPEEIASILAGLRSIQRKSEAEVRRLSDFWVEWLREPFAHVVDASTLTPSEREAFVIKDNVNLGQWDWDALDNFDQEDLRDWGLQTWGSLQPLMPVDSTPTATPPTASADCRERIIVMFPRDRRMEAERLLHLLGAPQKQAYRIDELINRATDE